MPIAGWNRETVDNPARPPVGLQPDFRGQMSFGRVHTSFVGSRLGDSLSTQHSLGPPGILRPVTIFCSMVIEPGVATYEVSVNLKSRTPIWNVGQKY